MINQFGINSVSESINSVSIRYRNLSIRYQFGEIDIFPVTEFIFPVIFSIFSEKYSNNTGLIDIFPVNKNNFSGLIIPKYSRLCRNFWSKVCFSGYQFGGFLREFPRVFRNTGKIPKRYPDRNEWFLDDLMVFSNTLDAVKHRLSELLVCRPCL